MSSRNKSKRDPAARQKQTLARKVTSAMTTIYDPATPNIDLFNMGMIYDVRVLEEGQVELDMAFSSPEHLGNFGLPEKVKQTVEEIGGVSQCKVTVVKEPKWSMDRVTEYARIHLSVVGDND